MDLAHNQNVVLWTGGCKIRGEVVLGDLIVLSSMCVAQVPWPPRSMAESWKRRLQWEKWSSKTPRGAVRPTDQPVGRGDAHGHVFPTRGQCRSRARWVSCGWSEKTLIQFCLAEHTTKSAIKQSASNREKLLPCENVCVCFAAFANRTNFLSSQSDVIL